MLAHGGRYRSRKILQASGPASGPRIGQDRHSGEQRRGAASKRFHLEDHRKAVGENFSDKYFLDVLSYKSCHAALQERWSNYQYGLGYRVSGQSYMTGQVLRPNGGRVVNG